MTQETLLEVVRRRFGVIVDPDSDGGQILASLTPAPDFTDQSLSGDADLAPLGFAPTPGGVSVRAARATDALVFSLPAGQVAFTLVPRPPEVDVEITLIAPTIPVPFLRPAQLGADDRLQPTGGTVSLHLPDLLLVVTAGAGPSASARLTPERDAGGALVVTMTPPFALLGPGAVLGFGFAQAALDLEGPEPEVAIPTTEVYIAPDAVPALAMHGGGRDLRLGLGTTNGGLSGDLAVSLAEGAPVAQRPRFLRNAAARLRLDRNAVTLLELTGQIELAAEISARLGMPLLDGPGDLDYRLGLVLDDGWQVSLRLSASGGGDYLWRTRRSNLGARDLARDTLGALAVFSPLLVPNLPNAGSSGYVDLALGAGAAGALAGSRWISTQSITLFGGELIVRRPPGGAAEGFLLLDLETELDLDVHVGAARLLATRRPLKVRQKAIGLRLDFGGSGAAPKLEPVFDPGQGFSLDLSDPGTFAVPGPLGEILQPDAARIARENPLTFEVDLVTKAELGIVTIDRASIRVPLDSPALPTLTGLGARLEAGPVRGGGYLKVLADGIAGGLDVSLAPPLGLRASADLRLGKAHDEATGQDLVSVLAGLSVEWPVPIPLANSGLGLFGFLGLFGVHVERQEDGRGALQWLIEARGNPAKGAWRGAAQGWALGLGAVIGTVEGGFLLHAKGMLMLELPGPRLLLVMKADMLSARPPKEGTDTGTLLAIIDIRPQSLTIGVVAEYRIPFLLEMRLPAEAFFDFDKPENWHLDFGAIPEGNPPGLPVSVKFMSVLRADGYLLVHGDGIPNFPLRKLTGFSVAAGIRAALTWGPKEIGLYLRVAARADVGICFKPLVILGKLQLDGELHLFIVSIGASASAELTISADAFFVKAEVCGEIDFFFFEVHGCVTLKLGGEHLPLPPPDPLVRALSLHSRTPALLPGSGADRPVDGSLGTAFHLGPAGQFVGDAPGATMPVVPIDAIPVLQLEMRPNVGAACAFFGTAVPSLLDAKGWVRRGERCYRYMLKAITLTATDAGGAPVAPLDEGDTPVVWWDRHANPAGGDDSEVQLALLDWVPDATPAAAERTISRDNRIQRRWGDICAEVAPPAPVLWTFTGVAAGPAGRGWTLSGAHWPDLPGTIRSAPPRNLLRVTEPWRSGDALIDALGEVVPAYVFASSAVAERLLVAPRTGPELRPRIADDARFDALLQVLRVPGLDALPDALRLDTDGMRRLRVLAFRHGEAGELVVRGLDADGGGTGFEQVIDAANSWPVQGTNDLPGDWGDPGSPWFATVAGVINAWFQVYVGPLGEPPLVFFELDLPGDTAQVEIGLLGGFEATVARWGVLLVEALPLAEFARFSFDETRRKARIDVVDGALGADQAKRALLRPGATYTVQITYDVASTGTDDQGNPREGAAVVVADQQQQFRFSTDAQPPERLESWVVATSPADGEASFFYAEPLRVVFATPATRKLFKAYGRDLFAVVKAASGRHPPESPGFDPSRIMLAAAQVAPATVTAMALTPFESALRESLVDQPCVDLEARHQHHERITLTMQLEPLTEYILDLEAEPSAGDPSSPMLRRNFSTSRYADMPAFAADVASRPIVHRHLASVVALTRLAAANPGPAMLAVRDADFEAALREARWGDLGRPGTPRMTVIWQGAGGGPPQPFALLLETTERVWRERGVPELVTDADGVKRYRLVNQAWLDLVETSAGVPKIARLVRSTDGARTLAVLQPGTRGSTVRLSLRRTPHPLFEGGAVQTALLADVHLTQAPWEALR